MVTLAENFVTYNMKGRPAARAANQTCNICRVNRFTGFGDCGGQIGLASEAAAALMNPDD
jgi:hypothetical protein